MIRIGNVGFEIVMVVTVKIAVNWNVLECSLVERYYCLGGCAASIFWMEEDGGSTFL